MLEAQVIPGSKASIEAPSFTYEKIVFVPLASFAKAYGLAESWNFKTKIVTIQSPQAKISFRAGSEYVLVNGKIMRMPAQAKMMNGQMLIPFQFGLQIFKSNLSPNTNLKPPPTLNKLPPQQNYFAKQSFSVLLDPGHGGHDIGARGRKGFDENDINLDITKRVRDKLINRGIKVSMTRTQDQYVTLWKRIALANTANSNLFVSIHTNAAKSKTVNGAEIFYYGGANKSQNGANYKQNLSKSYRFAKLVQWHLSKDVKIKSRGVKSARYFVLKNARVPAILIEVGFITHAWEGNKLFTPSYRNEIAQAIVESILDYKGRK